MSPALQRLRWIMPVAILALAALLRLWALNRPDTLVFDELYYVRDAVSQLAHGYPTVWPDSDPAFGGERARAFGDQASTIAHPPLGKWLIGIGILLFGADSGWGWRIAVAFAGVATVGFTMLTATRITRSHLAGWSAGLLLAVDGVHIVLTRVSLLDGFLAWFVVLGALFIAEDWLRDTASKQLAAVWKRPWLLAAGVAFGAAAAVKWSGLYPLGAFLVLITARDLFRARLGSLSLPRALSRAGAAAVITLTTAFAAYLATWLGWVTQPGGWGRTGDQPWWVSLWNWHTHSFSWHATLDAPHPYQAHPLGWPLGLRPTVMYHERWNELVAIITPIPNPLVTWGGVAALVFLAWTVARGGWQRLRTGRLSGLDRRTLFVSAFVLTGYLSGWLPWVLTPSRPAVFQFYAVVLAPFGALALALALTALCERRPRGGVDPFSVAGVRLGTSPPQLRARQLSVGMFLTITVLLSLAFWPLWIGMPIDHWFYRSHLWLPGW